MVDRTITGWIQQYLMESYYISILLYRCECPDDFDGPHCQQLRHSFSGNGWAWYDYLQQCEYDTLSVDIATTSNQDMLLLYNGPMTDTGTDTTGTPDFLSLELISGYPRMRMSLGSGELTLELDGQNSNGELKLPPLFDGAWHTIEIIKNGLVRSETFSIIFKFIAPISLWYFSSQILYSIL